MTSFQQKLKIINQHSPEHYSEYQRLTQIKGDGIEIPFYPLSFSQKHEGKDYPLILTHPFEYCSKEWDELMNVNDKTKFSGLFLMVVNNGVIIIDKFLDVATTEKTPTENAISEICGINIPRSEMIRQLETLEDVFIKKKNGKLKPLNDIMFDFLVYYFGTKMQKAFIKYAHSEVIGKRTQLQSLNADEQNPEYKVSISIDNEVIYFQRIVSDIYAGKVWDAVGNSQMIQYSRFRLKVLNHFKALTIEDKKRLVQSRDTSGKNGGALLLYIASFFNLKTIVEFLLEYTVPFPGNEEPYPPLFAACERGHDQIVKLLLLEGASVNGTNRIGITPLIAACQNNHKHIVELLMEHSAELEKVDINDWTPLKWACILQYEDIVNHLISENANVETTCKYGYTPLMWCCVFGNLSLVKLLVERNATINSANNYGRTSLMEACFFRREQIVTYLLDNHANINQSDDDGWTPVMEACFDPSYRYATLVFDNNNSEWNQVLEHFGHVEENNPWITLLKKVAILEKTSVDNVGYNQIVEILIDRGADINKIDADGKTALLHACRGRFNRIVHILLERGADVNKKDNDGETPLTEACFGEDEDVVMPIMEAGNTKIKPIIDQLLAAGADANATNNDGWNPFFDACKNGKIDIAAKLIKKIDVNKPYTKEWTPLQLALQNGHDDIYELFQDEDLVEEDRTRKRLTKEGMKDELIEACENGNLEEVESLIANYYCVDVNCHTDSDSTPLLEACKGNFPEIVDLLLEAGASVNEYDDMCKTPLYEACKAGAYVIVKTFLKLPLQLEVNASDNRGLSPILIACQNGHVSISELLVDRQADVDIANNAGITPLIVACRNGDKAMVRMLLSKKVDVNKSDAYGDTPLMVASYFGHIEIVKMFCSKSAHMDVKDCQGYTCLFWACKGKHRNLVEFLLKNNTSLDTLDQNIVIVNFLIQMKYEDCVTRNR